MEKSIKDKKQTYRCVICSFEGYEQEMDAHVNSYHPDWVRAWNLARPGWLLEVHNKIRGCKQDENKGQGALVVVDRDKLAKQIEAMCGAYRKGKDNLTNMCYEAIAYCEMMEKVSQRESPGCDWVDEECFVNPHRCSLAKAGICQFYALHGKGEHGKLKSGERVSG